MGKGDLARRKIKNPDKGHMKIPKLNVPKCEPAHPSLDLHLQDTPKPRQPTPLSAWLEFSYNMLVSSSWLLSLNYLTFKILSSLLTNTLIF